MARLGQHQECSTGPEINITRLNSQHESSHIFSQPLASAENMQSHSAIDITHVARRTDAGSQSTYPLADHRLGSDKPSDFEVDSMPFLTATEIEDFDTFFGNFLDVGLPNCSNDQLLLNLDMSDFEFAGHDLA
ncbi:unnamed protein product [Penicillium glandicola]